MNATTLSRVLLVAVPLAAVLVFLLQLTHAYATLPPRIAVHFGLSGRPDGWMSPRLFRLFTLLILALALGSITNLALTAPSSILVHPLPPAAGLVALAGIGLAIGAFSQIVLLAHTAPAVARLRWPRILVWPVTLVAVELLLQGMLASF